MLFRLSKNAIALLAVALIEKVANVLFFAIIARTLTKAEFGVYGLVVTFFIIGGILANFGLEYVIIRDVAKDRKRASDLFNTSFLITLIFSLLIWPLMVMLASVFNYDSQVVTLVGIGGLVLVFMGLSQTASGVMKAFERMEIFALVGTFFAVLSLGLGLCVLYLGGKVTELILVLLLSEGLKTLALTAIVHRHFARITWRLDGRAILVTIKHAVPYALLMAYGMLFRRISHLLIGMMRPLEDVAIYGAASKFADFLTLFSLSMVGALFPAFSSVLSTSKSESFRLYINSIAVFAIVGFGAGFATVVLSKPIILFLFGEMYLEGTVTLRWLGGTFLFSVLSGPVGIVLLSAGDQMYRLLIMCLVVIGSNILLAFWLIPTLSYNGAAFAMFVSTFLGFIGRLVLARTYFGKVPNLAAVTWRPFVASIGMAIVLFYLREMNLLFLILVGGFAYFLFLVVTGETKQDRYRPIAQKLVLLKGKLF